jgi:hypothetical protein
VAKTSLQMKISLIIVMRSSLKDLKELVGFSFKVLFVINISVNSLIKIEIV